MNYRFWALLAAGVWVVLAGCAPAGPAPTATTPATAAPTPSPIPATPTLHAFLPEPMLVESPLGRRGALGLIRNQAPFAVERIDLRMTFLSSAGDTLHRERLRPLLPYLAPGEASPVHLEYKGSPEPSSIGLEVISYRVREAPTVQPVVDVQQTSATAEGGTRVLGEVELQNEAEAARIDGYAVANESPDGKLTSLARAVLAPSYLASGELLPFEALLPTQARLTSIRTYVSASPAERRPPSPVEVVLTPGWSSDPQGRPFLVGIVRNPTDTTVAAEILLAFRHDGELVQVIGLDGHVPLAPGEQRPFGVRELALPKDVDPTAVELEPIIVPPAPGEIPPRVETLRMDIAGAEALGSNFFLRGQVSNDGPAAVANPTLFAALRATDGTLWTAGWLQLGDTFAAGQSEMFVLSLPLPEGIEVPLGEFDLRALGTTPR